MSTRALLLALLLARMLPDGGPKSCKARRTWFGTKKHSEDPLFESIIWAMRASFIVFAVFAVAGAGCGAGTVTSLPDGAAKTDASGDLGPIIRGPTPDPWARELLLTHFDDLNPDPHIVEVNLDARMAEWEYAPGKTVHAMTYNGSVPGPLLEAHAGDQVLVHFSNHLSEPTSVHWHGVRVPADMDGSPMSQKPVPPGGTFEYRFLVPDAGTFWYHTHVNEPVQMQHGLYGPIVVEGESEPRVDHAGIVMLSDLLLGADGQIAPPGDLLEQHSGREGDILLVNGRAGVTVPMRAGERQRFRMVNAGSARFYKLGLAGHRFTVLGSDGGFIATPYETDSMILVPGDRADLIVTGSAAPGASVTLQNLPYSRGHGAGVVVAEDILQIKYNMDGPITPLALPVSFPPIAALSTTGIAPRTLTFAEVLDDVAMTISFTIDGKSYPNVPDIEAKVGKTEVWDLVNMSEMDHPFHLHGFFFQIVSRNGVAEAAPTWEDTTDLHGHEHMRIVFYPEARPGMWMYHCHILEHTANGMMAAVHVAP